MVRKPLQLLNCFGRPWGAVVGLQSSSSASRTGPMAEIARKAVQACGGTEPPSGVGGTIFHEVEERLLATRIPAKLLKTSYLSIGRCEASRLQRPSTSSLARFNERWADAGVHRGMRSVGTRRQTARQTQTPGAGPTFFFGSSPSYGLTNDKLSGIPTRYIASVGPRFPGERREEGETRLAAVRQRPGPSPLVRAAFRSLRSPVLFWHCYRKLVCFQSLAAIGMPWKPRS